MTIMTRRRPAAAVTFLAALAAAPPRAQPSEQPVALIPDRVFDGRALHTGWIVMAA